MSHLRRAVRATVPEPLRRMVALARRSGSDWWHATRFATGRTSQMDWPVVIRISQPIRQSELWQGKLANIVRGAARIDGMVLAPGETLSFWHAVGRPSLRNGFATGRAIRGGTLEPDIGGGLCQLSGLIYELGLRGGLKIAERHPHSRDLYTEEERFTPLGLDATVVWPWRDLRLTNHSLAPVILRLGVRDMIVEGALLSSEQIMLPTVAIERCDQADTRRVRVTRGCKTISDDLYQASPATGSSAVA